MINDKNCINKNYNCLVNEIYKRWKLTRTTKLVRPIVPTKTCWDSIDGHINHVLNPCSSNCEWNWYHFIIFYNDTLWIGQTMRHNQNTYRYLTENIGAHRGIFVSFLSFNMSNNVSRVEKCCTVEKWHLRRPIFIWWKEKLTSHALCHTLFLGLFQFICFWQSDTSWVLFFVQCRLVDSCQLYSNQ